MENDKLTLTVDETAKILGVGRNSAYEAIARGEIPVVKVGKRLLVPKAALEKLLNGRLLKSKDEVNQVTQVTPTRNLKGYLEPDQLGMQQTQLQDIERQLKVVDREQHQFLQWALKGFPENQVEAENWRLNKARGTLKDKKTELETQIKAGQDAVINIPKLESFI